MTFNLFGKQRDQLAEGLFLATASGKVFPFVVLLELEHWLANFLQKPAVSSPSPQRCFIASSAEIVISKITIDPRPRYSNFVTWVMGVSCSWREEGGLETHWRERRIIINGKAEQSPAITQSYLQPKCRGMSNGTPCPIGIWAAQKYITLQPESGHPLFTLLSQCLNPCK